MQQLRQKTPLSLGSLLWFELTVFIHSRNSLLKEHFTHFTNKPYLNYVLNTIIILLGLLCVQIVLLEIFIFRILLCSTVLLNFPQFSAHHCCSAPPPHGTALPLSTHAVCSAKQ